MVRIKICGITGIKAALAVGEAGADYLGFVFAPSRRGITPETAADICSKIKKAGLSLKTVGVFVNSPVSRVNILASAVGLDIVQLSGDEDLFYIKQVVKPVIKVVRVGSSTRPAALIATVEKLYLSANEGKITCLLDTEDKESWGGTGKVFNWEIAGKLTSVYPAMVAGGLNPENVAELITRVKPWGVDVSSGVESGGDKDSVKIRNFIEAVKKADLALNLRPGGKHVTG